MYSARGKSRHDRKWVINTIFRSRDINTIFRSRDDLWGQ